MKLRELMFKDFPLKKVLISIVIFWILYLFFNLDFDLGFIFITSGLYVIGNIYINNKYESYKGNKEPSKELFFDINNIALLSVTISVITYHLLKEQLNLYILNTSILEDVNKQIKLILILLFIYIETAIIGFIIFLFVLYTFGDKKNSHWNLKSDNLSFKEQFNNSILGFITNILIDLINKSWCFIYCFLKELSFLLYCNLYKKLIKSYFNWTNSINEKYKFTLFIIILTLIIILIKIYC